MLRSWSAGLEAPGRVEDAPLLEAALLRDRQRLRERLVAIVRRPEVREALFVAAPELDPFVERWIADPDSDRERRVESALVRYFHRMAGRATPFGLFAGTSVGTLDAVTDLSIGAIAQHQRHTRLDMDYLVALLDTLSRDPNFLPTLVYVPNSSLYTLTGRVRYVESRFDGLYRTQHLVAIDESAELDAVLTRARHGASVAELSATLAERGVQKRHADAYVRELIASQVLVSDATPALTGPEPHHTAIARLERQPATRGVAARLAEVCRELAAMDAAGLGQPIARYRAVMEVLTTLPAPVEPARLFQVDLVRPFAAAKLGRDVLVEIERGVALLHALFAEDRSGDLSSFCRAFVDRYDQREVRLVEALDEELGVGYPPNGEASEDASPLVDGLDLESGANSDSATWGRRDAWLLRRLALGLAEGAQEISLQESEVDNLRVQGSPLPDAFAVLASVAAADAAALRRGEFLVVLRAVSGPSGASLLGRFCHADTALHSRVEHYLRREEALHPDTVFAEVVHLPDARTGNILLRPVLREYEIPYLGRSGAAVDRQLPVTDLWVSVRDGRVHLRSERLGRPVVPRLTSAHAFEHSTSGVYRFLCTLQFQGTAAGLAWSWGPLAASPFLPRVTAGRLVLSPASWTIDVNEVRHLKSTSDAERFRAVWQWRTRRRLPRWISLQDGENALPLDLDNALSVDAFVRLISDRGDVVITELLPGPDELCLVAPEGRFVHELVVPFVGRRRADAASSAAKTTPDTPRPKRDGGTVESTPSPRRFPPGAEWLYVKLYTGTTATDRLLLDMVRPLVDKLTRAGDVDHWYFVRYGDPDWHVRLRLHGDAKRLPAVVLSELRRSAAAFAGSGRLWRLQLDTYEREVERYGGTRGVELAERLFHADSEAALDIIDMLEPGDAGLDERWRLTLLGMDMLLDDLELADKHALVSRLRDAFAKDAGVRLQTIEPARVRFRRERASLEALLDPTPAPRHPLRPGIRALARRSRRWAPTVKALKGCVADGELAVPLADFAASLLHMHANRMLRAAHRSQEIVIYDYLTRLYESARARRR